MIKEFFQVTNRVYSMVETGTNHFLEAVEVEAIYYYYCLLTAFTKKKKKN